jgi:hypothetical protein
MPFTNDIAGGQGSLVINWLQSANFVTGVSGWQIRKDGNVEFNNGTFRGSITSGNPAAQHLIINNPVTGDAVDVYDTLNRLVLAITANGVLETILRPSNSFALLQGNALAFGNTTSPPTSQAVIVGTSNNLVSHILIDSGRSIAVSGSSSLEYLDSNTGLGGKSYVRAIQKADGVNPNVTGSIVQTDTDNAVNNVIHAGYYGGTTDGAGNLVLAHGCAFTPSAAVITVDASGTTNPNIVGSMRSAVLGATNFTTSWFIANTGAGYATSIVRFSAIFFG